VKLSTQARPSINIPAPTRALHLWHLLSLDAPTVAVLWTAFIARAASVRLPLAGLAAMFLAVWSLYAADRLLDARQLFADPLHTTELEARHLFHHRHTSAFLTGIVIAAVTLAALLPRLSPPALRLYAILGTLLFAWFLLIHARAAAALRLPKELAVGIFFPAAVFIPTVARHPELRLALLPHAALFAAVCTLNCLCIYAWEHPTLNSSTEQISAQTSAHWTTRHAIRHLVTLAVITTLAGLALTIVTLKTPFSPIALAASLSALTLLALHRQHQRISPLTLRAAADLALLPPIALIILPFALRRALREPPRPLRPSLPNFNPIATPYRWLEYLTFGPTLQRCRTHFIPAVTDKKSALVLGDGDGRFLAQLFLHANPALQAEAVDTSTAMLRLLEARNAPNAARLHTHHTNALNFTPTRSYDLIATNFFLDCLTQPELDSLIHRLTPALQPHAVWLISDFRIPTGPMRIPAKLLVRSLYLAFRIITGLQTTHLPGHATPLAAAGFTRIAHRHSLAGILTAELWQFTMIPPSMYHPEATTHVNWTKTV